jgi:hypothetical protein
MVKKIRLIDEPEETNTSSEITSRENNSTFNNELLELAKTMDWKLWEILQSVQRLETEMKNKMDKGT